jgi:hypothetical protein
MDKIDLRAWRRTKAERKRAIMRGRREYLRRTGAAGHAARAGVRKVWLDHDLLGELSARFACTTIVLRRFFTSWRVHRVERIIRECCRLPDDVARR